MNKITEKQLIRLVAGYTKQTILVVSKVVDSLKETIMDELRNDNKVALIGFGSFEPFIRHERKGVNPRNPKEITLRKEIKVAKFRTGYKMKRYMKKST